MTSVLDQVLAAENLHDLTPQALEAALGEVRARRSEARQHLFAAASDLYQTDIGRAGGSGSDGDDGSWATLLECGQSLASLRVPADAPEAALRTLAARHADATADILAVRVAARTASAISAVSSALARSREHEGAGRVAAAVTALADCGLSAVSAIQPAEGPAPVCDPGRVSRLFAGAQLPLASSRVAVAEEYQSARSRLLGVCSAALAARVATPTSRAVISVARSGKEGQLKELWAALASAGIAEREAAGLASRVFAHSIAPLLRSGATAATAAMNPPGAPVAMMTWTLTRPASAPPGPGQGPPKQGARGGPVETGALGPFAAAAAVLKFIATEGLCSDSRLAAAFGAALWPLTVPVVVAATLAAGPAGSAAWDAAASAARAFQEAVSQLGMARSQLSWRRRQRLLREASAEGVPSACSIGRQHFEMRRPRVPSWLAVARTLLLDNARATCRAEGPWKPFPKVFQMTAAGPGAEASNPTSAELPAAAVGACSDAELVACVAAAPAATSPATASRTVNGGPLGKPSYSLDKPREVSMSVVRLAAFIEGLLDEACASVAAAANDGRGDSPAAGGGGASAAAARSASLRIRAAADCADLLRIVIPAIRLTELDTIPAAAMLFRNDCHFLSFRLLGAGYSYGVHARAAGEAGGRVPNSPLAGVAAALLCTGNEALAKMIRLQCGEVGDELGAADGFYGTAVPARRAAGTRALAMARHRLLRFSGVACATLPLQAAEDAVRDVVDDLGQRVSADILSQSDISVEECEVLRELISSVLPLDDVLRPVDTPTGSVRLSANKVGSALGWRKLRAVHDLLDAKMVEIAVRLCSHSHSLAAWENGALVSVGLSRAEVVRFLNAVFSDSQLRRDCIARVMAQAYHEHTTVPEDDDGGPDGARGGVDDDDEDGGGGAGGSSGESWGGEGAGGGGDHASATAGGEGAAAAAGPGAGRRGGLTTFLLRQGGALGMIAPAPSGSSAALGGGNRSSSGAAPNI